MEFTQFTERLKKLNPDLRVSRKDATDSGYSERFRNIGLHLKEKYLFAIPRQDVPKWSLVERGGRILARGYVAILEMLVKKKLIVREKAERLFDCTLFQFRAGMRPQIIMD